MMKKRCLLLLTALALLAVLTACAGGNGSGGSTSAGGAGAPTAGAPMEEPGAVPESYDALDFSGTAAGSARTYAGEDAKLIQRAELSLQTTDFAAAVDALDALVEAQGGYYESASVRGGGYYDQNAARYGSYMVRLPKDRYEGFLSAAGEVGRVAYLNRSAEDVGEAYFDAESRLRTQETKRDRLHTLLERAETMEDIIALESALSDVEYQIEQYSTQLRRYDSLVDFATVSVTLEEVVRVADAAGPADGLGARLSAALSEGLAGAGEGLGNFVVWCAYHLVGLLVTAAIVAAAAVVLVRRYRKRAAPPPPPAPPGDGEKRS